MDAAALWLYQNNVGSVISIEKDNADKTRDVIELFPGFKWYSCFLDDWHAPSVDHLWAYCQQVKELAGTYNVATHCWGGTGRTGCFLAAYLLYDGHADSAQAALKMVREDYNTHSVEMMAQYNALARFSDILGNQPSLPCFVDEVEPYFAGGHWHGGHGEDGMAEFDPGHAGEKAFNGRYPDYKDIIEGIIVSADGWGFTRDPYLTRYPDSAVHGV